jgi:DNA-binding GntR family transcriptional regulator
MNPANIVFRSKKEAVYDTLRNAILQGDLKPGARLVIDKLAAELGVSQIPIREALQQLEGEGFVTIEPYVGVTVSDLETGSITEIFGLLEALEVVSGRIACQKLSDDDLNQIEAMLRHIDTLLDDPDRFSEENKRLHHFICDRAGTRLVKEFMTTVLAHWDRLRRHYLNDVFTHRLRVAQADHWAMLAAWRTRDPERVEQCIRQHNRSARTDYVNYLANLTDGKKDE